MAEYDDKEEEYEDPDEELFWGGFLAICEKFPDEDFFLTTLYHEWFIVDNRKILGG